MRQSVSLEKLLDEFIQQRTARHNDIKEEIKIYDQLNQNITLGLESGKIKLSELNSTLLVIIKNKSSLDDKIAEQYQKEKAISTALSAVNKQIEQFKNDTVIEAENPECQNDDVCTGNSTTINIQTNYELEKAVEWADQILQEIDEKRLKIDEWPRTPHPVNYDNRLEAEINNMTLEVGAKQKLAALELKKVQKIQSIIPDYTHFQEEALQVNNKIDDCLNVLTTIFHNLMIDNYGKTLENVCDDGKELYSVCVFTQ
ncbi:uncharacterized protein LOC126846185 [Adelges cooleyi]|uniref:uncharacterized protein LOC126846185 n=1 Tax=Adelges cooleyi TaxID=133065 RepID=UPI0021804F51|nr:uncharacterized protein LOC126846185 [Adelges cooleyi]